MLEGCIKDMILSCCMDVVYASGEFLACFNISNFMVAVLKILIAFCFDLVSCLK